MNLRYFAYGSNLCLTRLKSRVPGVRTLGPARLPGHELAWNKRSVDGSAKCSIEPSTRTDSEVHGVLYTMPADQKPRLDSVEGLGVGYLTADVEVEAGDGVRTAFTYVAAESHVAPSLLPFDWYKELVVAGAKGHGLPDDYVEGLERASSRPDPRADRAKMNRQAIPCGAD